MKLSNFLLENITLTYGKILYLDMDIDLKKNFEEQKWSYKEDMLQIGFDDTFTIDVGWTPEHESNGHFVLTVVKNYNWYKPLVRTKIKNFDDLKKNLEIEVNKLEKICNKCKIKSTKGKNSNLS